MAITYQGKPFTGVTYNQGSYTGDRGHIFIKGIQQCSYALNAQGRNRIWESFKSIAYLKSLILEGKVCKMCAKNVNEKIQQLTEGK